MKLFTVLFLFSAFSTAPLLAKEITGVCTYQKYICLNDCGWLTAVDGSGDYKIKTKLISDSNGNWVAEDEVVLTQGSKLKVRYLWNKKRKPKLLTRMNITGLNGTYAVSEGNENIRLNLRWSEVSGEGLKCKSLKVRD